MTIPIGVYEKAFPDELSWEERLNCARAAGYDFLDISIDESDERLARLRMPASERAALRETIANTGVPILVMGLSGHRRFPLGSASPALRAAGLDLLRRGVELASDLNVRIIQVMGYDVYYEPSTADSAARFVDSLYEGVGWASAAGVMLGLENVDVKFVDCVEKALRYVLQVDSPWLTVFPDIGNMAAAGYDPVDQLPLAKGRIAAVHVKDVQPGQVRGIPFGQGIVQFDKVFPVLAGLGFCGPMTVEMWAHLDKGGDPFQSASSARQSVGRRVEAAWGNDEKGMAQ